MQADVLTEISILTNVDSHLQFLEQIVAQADLSLDQKLAIRQEITVLRQRSRDPDLYLAVVGEMSTGKSTFINALLRDNLLVAHARVMTTATATIFKPGTTMTADIRFHQLAEMEERRLTQLLKSVISRLRGHQEAGNDEENLEFLTDAMRELPHRRIRVTPNDAPITINWLPNVKRLSFRDFVRRVTTEDEIARLILSMTVTHHAQFLSEGIFIIDTPGLDATNSDHTEVTHRVMQEADAAVVIIPADKPVSSAIINHLKDETLLGQYRHRCIFVVTRMDTIRARERDDLLKDIARRLQQGLSLVEPPGLFPASPQAITDGFLPADEQGVKADERDYWANQFVELERKFFARLKKERSLAVAESTLRVLTQTLTQVKSLLQALWGDYNRRLGELDRIRIRDLQAFAKEQHQQCETDVSPILSDTATRVELLVGKYRESLLEEVRKGLYATSNKGELTKFLKEQADPIVALNQQAFKRDYEAILYDMERKVQIVHRSFDTRFSQEYDKLKLIHQYQTVSINSAAQISVDVAKALSDAQRSNSQENTNTVIRAGTGVVAGAIIGQTLIPIPGVGAAVGALVGGFVMDMFGPNLQQRKDESWNKLQTDLMSSYAQIQIQVAKSCMDLGAKLESGVHARIDLHVSQYDRIVKDMLRAYAEEKVMLEAKQKALQANIQEIERRHGQVTQQRTRLLEIHI